MRLNRVVFINAALLLTILASILTLGSCENEEGMGKMTLNIKSVFSSGEMIPSKYTCEGADINPPLKLENLDSKAVSLAIIVDDPDAPIGTFVHWVAWNFPPVKEIPEGLPKVEKTTTPLKMVQGRNDFGRVGYNGPCPPWGHGIHHYHFTVYVLDTKLELKPGSRKKELEKAMKSHVIQQGELVGLYERK